MPKNVEMPLPKGSLIRRLIAESRAAGIPARDAEIRIWQVAIRRCKGNGRLLATWMGTNYEWTRRHLKRLGIFEELAAAREQ